MQITITFPKDRLELGTLVAGDFSCKCYGKADSMTAAGANNPLRLTTLAFGDTPAGTYAAKVGSVHANTHSFGPYPVVNITPTGGDALLRANNEETAPDLLGLLIHGGDLNDVHKLRPTHGCIRLHDEDQAALVALFGDGTHDLTITELP